MYLPPHTYPQWSKDDGLHIFRHVFQYRTNLALLNAYHALSENSPTWRPNAPHPNQNTNPIPLYARIPSLSQTRAHQITAWMNSTWFPHAPILKKLRICIRYIPQPLRDCWCSSPADLKLKGYTTRCLNPFPFHIPELTKPRHTWLHMFSTCFPEVFHPESTQNLNSFCFSTPRRLLQNPNQNTKP